MRVKAKDRITVSLSNDIIEYIKRCQKNKR